MSGDLRTFVIDLGGGCVKIGFAGDKSHRASSRVAETKLVRTLHCAPAMSLKTTIMMRFFVIIAHALAT